MLLKQCTTSFLLLGALVSAIPHNGRGIDDSLPGGGKRAIKSSKTVKTTSIKTTKPTTTTTTKTKGTTTTSTKPTSTGEADDIDCSWKTCGQTCKAFGKRDDLLDLALRGVLDADDNDPEGLTYNVTASDELAPPGEDLRLSKRAGNLFQLPAGKSVDGWFADALKKPENHFLLGPTNAELLLDTDPSMTSGGTRGSHYDLANKEIMMIMPGLFGCTAVVIVNHESAWMIHHWDSSFKTDKTHREQLERQKKPITTHEDFRNQVLREYDYLPQWFTEDSLKQTHVIIYTRARTDAPQIQAKEPAYFHGMEYHVPIDPGPVKFRLLNSLRFVTDQVEGMKERILQKLPGVKIHVEPYSPQMRLAININVAGGKLRLFYDNKADNKKAQFAL
ncbi:hypothetical protein GQ607_015916 [Colletotrichum asianum]|uniref:Uncharacterized protein n=1 Tax=Colletotrichum asianum TaxID=702518 RepID=A0A8H3W023_9PEZI|nr:hypothetical protein GQ607_015916 [Colletotrichum asianum]